MSLKSKGGSCGEAPLRGGFYWPNSRKGKRWARDAELGGGEEKTSLEEVAECCVLTSCCPIPLSLFQLKELRTDVLPVVGIGWERRSSEVKAGLICQPLSKNRVAALIGAWCVCVCVAAFVPRVSLILELCSSALCLSLLSLCLTHRPCHEFSLTPWGHSHMKL